MSEQTSFWSSEAGRTLLAAVVPFIVGFIGGQILFRLIRKR